jgi:hypothetical protein
VVQTINNKSRNSTEFIVIIESCRSLLISVQNCMVIYVRRQVNRVAHDLPQTTCFIVSS